MALPRPLTTDTPARPQDRRGRYRRRDATPYRGRDRRQPTDVAYVAPSTVVAVGLVIAAGAGLIWAAGELPAAYTEAGWLQPAGVVIDGVAIGFSLLAALLWQQREKLTGDAFSSRCGAALVVLGLLVVPADLASDLTDSTAPLAVGLSARVVLLALVATLLSSAEVSSTVRLSRLAASGVLAAVASGSLLLIAPVYAVVIERQEAPLARPVLGSVVALGLVLAVILAGTGLRRRDVRYQVVVLLVSALAITTTTVALDDLSRLSGLVARGTRLVGITLMLYAVAIELRNVVVAERQHALASRMEAARAADRLVERLRHQEEVVHDARSSLLAIQGGVTAAGRTTDDAAMLDAVALEIERLRSFLTDGRDTSIRPFDVRQALEPMITCYQVAGFPVTLAATGEQWAHGRAADTAEVVQNLVDNAISHADGEEILVWVGGSEDALCIRVADRGPGIAGAQRHRVFERGGSVGSPLGGGLGLYTARRLVEAQGGELDVDDRDGGGALFSVLLRRAAPVAAAEASPTPAATEPVE